MSSDWRCDRCGAVPPLHLPRKVNSGVLTAAVGELTRDADRLPLWSLWPLPLGWTVTGVGWAGDERGGVRATVLATSGPAPLGGGPADLLLVAESPGVGLASRYAGLPSRDPGRLLAASMAQQPAHAKVRADGHPTPLWSVPAEGRSAYVGEARGVWLVAVAWPPSAGYLLVDDDVALHDLASWLPGELVFGAPSARLHAYRR